MLKSVLVNNSPSILLSFALIIGIGACFKQLDCLVMYEVKALISILFAVATSCLLSLNAQWHDQTLNFDNMPNMHPNARNNSMDSAEEQLTVSTISSVKLDLPPDYENALIHSKPVYKHDIGLFSQPQQSKQSNNNYQLDQLSWRSYYGVQLGCKNNEHQIVVPDSSQFCNPANMMFKIKETSAHTTLEVPGCQLAPVTDRRSRARSECRLNMNPSGCGRKESFVQLDVNQLNMLSSSPPKYYEVWQNRASFNLGNRSTDNR